MLAWGNGSIVPRTAGGTGCGVPAHAVVNATSRITRSLLTDFCTTGDMKCSSQALETSFVIDIL